MNSKVGGAQPVLTRQSGRGARVHTPHASLISSAVTQTARRPFQPLETTPPAPKIRHVYFPEGSSERLRRGPITHPQQTATSAWISSALPPPHSSLQRNCHPLPTNPLSHSPPASSPPPQSWCSPQRKCAAVVVAKLFPEAGAGMNGRHWPALQLPSH